jgi:hypothetical protein
MKMNKTNSADLTDFSNFHSLKLFCSKPSDVTVKAPNFGPHGNFGLFLASSVASVDESCTKNEQNRICRSIVFLQLLFTSFFCWTRFNDSKLFRK